MIGWATACANDSGEFDQTHLNSGFNKSNTLRRAMRYVWNL